MRLFERSCAESPDAFARLLRAAACGRLSHAYLIHSDIPELRESMALAFAQLGSCPSPLATGAPCGVCATCTRIERNTAMELHHLSPVGKMYQIQVGDRENPEPNTIRYFTEQFHLTGTSGARRKVGIIHEADRMNTEAQNALLKTLEEPPQETLLLLLTGNPEALLPTTRSRCQTFSILRNFRTFDFEGVEKVCAALGELCLGKTRGLAAAESGARTLIDVAGGLKDAAEARVRQEWEARLLAAAQIDESLVKRLERQCESAAAGAYIRARNDFLCAIHTYVAQLFLFAGGAARAGLANPELLTATQIPAQLDPERAARWLREAEQLLFNLRFNVNEALALRAFAVNLSMG